MHLVAFEYYDALVGCVGHETDVALLVAGHFLGEALGVQVLLQFIIAVLEQGVVVAVSQQIVRQNYEEEDDEEIKLQVLVGPNQHHDDEQIFGSRGIAEIMHEQQEQAQTVGNLIEQKLQLVHDIDGFPGLYQHLVDLVAQLFYFALVVCVPRVSEVQVLQVSRLSTHQVGGQLSEGHHPQVLGALGEEVVHPGGPQQQPDGVVVVELEDLRDEEVDEVELQFGEGHAEDEVRSEQHQAAGVGQVHAHRQAAVFVGLEEEFICDWDLLVLVLEEGVHQIAQLGLV